MNLIILGNGFDLVHGLKTKYSDFRKYLKNNSNCNNGYESLIDVLEELYVAEDLWSDLEEALGYPNLMLLKRLKKLFGYPFPSSQIADDLHKALKNWISAINSKDGKVKQQFVLSNDDRYFTFNYTQTLELGYNIADTNIKYIHNNVIGELMGHEKEKIICGCKYVIHDNVANELIKRTTKDVMAIIQNNKDYFENTAKGFTLIKVFGCSYSDIDYPYFEQIAINNANAGWIFGCKTGRDFDKAQKYAHRLGLDTNQYKIINSEQVFETKEMK